MAPPSLGFLFLLLCQNRLHHVPWLGDVRQINLWGNGLRRTRRACAGVAPLASMLKLRTNFVGLVVFNRTGVGLALSQAELCQHVKNLTAFHFHLAREIVDSNLAHLPLFETCYPKP